MKAFCLDDDQLALVVAYEDDQGAGPVETWARRAVRRFLAHVGGPEAWTELSVAEQLALDGRHRAVVAWLLATARLTASADYLVNAKTFFGAAYARYHPESYAEMTATARALGARNGWDRRQWAALSLAAALHGVAPALLSTEQIVAARDQLRDACRRVGRPDQAERLSAGLYRARITMFHLGLLRELPRKREPDGGAWRRQQWTSVPAGLAATLLRYVDQLALTRRPATVAQAEGTLREFALFLARTAPEVCALTGLERDHVEAYRHWLAGRPAHGQERPVSRKTQAKRIATLRSCFERIADWGWEDAPRPRLVTADDLPIPDRPLPRFIDDGAAARLLVAARAADDPFDRLAVEFLARTGLRIGEFLNLSVDAVVQIGSSFWLRVPIGKLHTDRYIPLHPQLKAQLDGWVAARPDGLRSRLLWVEQGRRIRRGRVVGALNRAAAAAGIGHVTPHQLRHTLATQAINRGMSLEALAALLGHKSLSMTLVYARIADRTVAEEYFAVTEKVEALYDQPKTLPADAEGSEMAKLRREMTQRMLGNGYCARPVQLDCHFETICESCTYFVTTVEFRPTLERQRDDAAAKHQLGRQRIFEGLLHRLDGQEAG